jgi:hypothetical protein
MIWLIILIPIGLLILFGILYDIFKNKGFKEMKMNEREVNMNAEIAKRDARTHENGSFNNFLN